MYFVPAEACIQSSSGEIISRGLASHGRKSTAATDSLSFRIKRRSAGGPDAVASSCEPAPPKRPAASVPKVDVMARGRGGVRFNVLGAGASRLADWLMGRLDGVTRFYSFDMSFWLKSGWHVDRLDG
eukprot:7494228-Heterocapsa_arctica.AAC.1